MQTSNLTSARIAIAASFFCFLAVITPNYTQAQTRLGFRLGASAAQKATQPYSQPLGLYAGVFTEKSISRKAVIRPELNVMMMRSKYTAYEGTQRVQKTLMQYRVQAPVLLSVEVLPHVSVMAGPQLNYSLTQIPEQSANPDVKSAANPPLTLGAAGGISFETTDGVELNLRAGYSTGWSSNIATNTGERITYSAGIAIPISGFNGVSNRNVSHSKFTGNSYQIPGE
jgi:hypothetical protein